MTDLVVHELFADNAELHMVTRAEALRIRGAQFLLYFLEYAKPKDGKDHLPPTSFFYASIEDPLMNEGPELPCWR
jgi:hypothetical protein